MTKRKMYIALAVTCFSLLIVMAWVAPDLPSTIDRTQRSLKPWEFPPLGTDMNGRPLIEYATQGAELLHYHHYSLVFWLLYSVCWAGCCDVWIDTQTIVQFFEKLLAHCPAWWLSW